MIVHSQTTILAFDDDASFLRQLKEHLSAEFNVETATTIPQAMKTIMTRNLDLILLDMNMPEMSGLEFLKPHVSGIVAVWDKR